MTAMVGELHVLSVYEGFFAGGARALHTAVVAGLHGRGRQVHSVLSIHREMRRETLIQRMENDARYRSLTAAGVPVASLGRGSGPNVDPMVYSDSELTVAAGHAIRADIILSLKEQPFHLLNQAGFPRTPVIVCLHRSDPANQGSALASLAAAVADGRVPAAICCAESTRTAYQAAGIPGSILQVIPNGVDLARFRPASARKRATLRRELGVPPEAKLVVFAARYAPMKNVPLFLRAARDYLKREPAGHVVMCGAGMSLANAELCVDIEATFADEPRLLQRLILLGVRGDMEALYAAADVVSLTSSVGEAAPLCLIEGAMCGAIPVATDVGDCASIVAGHGIITAPDPGAISAAWTEAVARRAEFGATLAASRPRFSLTRMIAAYATLIDRTYRGGRARGVGQRRPVGARTRSSG
ncbi:MAG TPA: glycosyltransferase [Micromonosporaceae bacterium]|nr:glycosyltransferase [Micromonosporaceae bacterium]